MRLFMTQHFWCLQPLRQHPATARHFWQPGNDTWNECITVVSPEVKKPVVLRYCFKNFQLGNMANAGGLPLFPFRTDKR